MGCRRVGERRLSRGDICWYTFRLPDKRRPVLILSRNEVADALNKVIVVPVTRTIRGLETEVVLTSEDGVPVPCALNFDHISLAQRARLGATISRLPPPGGLMSNARSSWRAASNPKRLANSGLKQTRISLRSTRCLALLRLAGDVTSASANIPAREHRGRSRLFLSGRLTLDRTPSTGTVAA